MAAEMTKEQIFELVSGVLADSFELERGSIRLSSHVVDDLDLDSIDAIDLAVGIEQETGLDVGEEDLGEIRHVQDIVDLIHAKSKDA